MRQDSPASGTKRQDRESGVTLIELMVALAIGTCLIVGAITVFVQSRSSFRATESVSRLQENMRIAMERMEPDIRMAGFWGLTTRAELIAGHAGANDPVAFAVASDCRPNWAVSVESAIDGSNNAFPSFACMNAYSQSAQAGADTIVVRRAEARPLPPGDAPQPGTLYVQTRRFGPARLFLGPDYPDGAPTAGSQVHRLIANAYYVSSESTLSTPEHPVPSLRVKTLVGGSSGPRIVDEEVLPGVEDMQVQFGIDTDAPGDPGRGTVDRYVNPDDPLLEADGNVVVLAVRLWLRVRSDQPEQDFVDTTDYLYADRSVAAPKDAHRRAVISKTIFLRNARPPS